MTTTAPASILTVLDAATSLVNLIGPERVRTVNVTTSTAPGVVPDDIRVHFRDEADGERVAGTLGYELAGEYYTCRTWRGTFSGATVTLFGAPAQPTLAVIVDADTGETLTGPMDAVLARKVVGVVTERHVRVQEVTR